MNDNNHKLIIDYLRGIAIILVVFGHAISFYYSNYSELSLFANVVINIVYSVNVPLFFLISGYVLHKQPLKAFYLKKASRIFVPFVFFSILKMIYAIVTNGFSRCTSVGEMLKDAFVYGDYYWFPYCILVVFFIAPLFWSLNGKSVWIVFLIVLICNIGLGVFDILPGRSVFQLSYSLVNLTWFLLGYLLQLYPQVINFIRKSTFLLFGAILSVVGIIIIYTFTGIRPQFVFKFLMSLSISLILFQLLDRCKIRIKILELASKYSLQVYFFDSFFKTILFSIFERLIPINWESVIIVTIFDMVLSISLCLICQKTKGVKTLVGLA